MVRSYFDLSRLCGKRTNDGEPTYGDSREIVLLYLEEKFLRSFSKCIG